LLSPLFLSQLQQLTLSSPRPQTLADPPFHQTIIQATFIRSEPAPTVMATNDHVPEVCFQVSILQVSAVTLYFFSS